MNKIFVLTGPSGAGKGSVADALVEKPSLKLRWVTTLTSRRRRKDDAELSRHYFTNKAGFKKQIKEGNILEYNIYNGNYYGTPKSSIEEIITDKYNPLLDIDINGARALKEIYKKRLVVIFISASLDELETRLRTRGMDDKVIEQRLLISKKELDDSNKFDYRIHNKQNYIEKTIDIISKIIEEEIENP